MGSQMRGFGRMRNILASLLTCVKAHVFHPSSISVVSESPSPIIQTRQEEAVTGADDRIYFTSDHNPHSPLCLKALAKRDFELPGVGGQVPLRATNLVLPDLPTYSCDQG